MPRSLLAAAAAAHSGLSRADSTTSFQRYEERVSPFTVNLPRRLDLEDTASSKISILPPLTHPSPPQPQPYITENLNVPPASQSCRPELPVLHPYSSGAGAEPGVNPCRGSSIAKYSHFKQECLIDIIDFDADDANIERLGNSDFINMMKNGYAKEIDGDPDHHPRAVRWINIAGIDWDVLSSMALRYHVHSLALEDVLHERGDIQSKADYYPDHMFIRVLCHSIYPIDEHGNHLHLMNPECHYRYGARRRQYKGGAPPAYGTADLESGNRQDLSNIVPAAAPSISRQERSSSSPFLSSLALHTPFSSLSERGGSRTQKQAMKLQALTAKDRLNVRHDPMYIFLFHDGTVISVMPTANLDFTAPITERLYHSQSVLRTSEDASLLMEALLDLVVDRILEVVDEYQMKIHKLEHDIMLNPNMDTIRSLHVLSGDLIMHKLTLEPIKTTIYNLRRYDVDRCIAMANHIKAEASDESDSDSDAAAAIVDGTRRAGTSGASDGTNNGPQEGKPNRKADNVSLSPQQRADGELEGDSGHQTPAHVDSGQSMSRRKRTRKRKATRKSQKRRDAEKAERLRWERAWQYTSDGTVKGYLSYKCKVYLGDVSDHMDFALTSLDMFAGVSENLIDYAFNVASYEMNQVMSRLTIVTIIFLPLTLLTGYFGMNFDPFKGLDGHSEFLFWKIAIPAMAALIPLFMFHELKNFAKTVSRNWSTRRVTKASLFELSRRPSIE